MGNSTGKVGRPTGKSENKTKVKLSEWQKRYDKAMLLVSPDGSSNRAAGILDVSRQAMKTWQDQENVPILRALMIDRISGGKIPWQELSPETVREIDDIHQYFKRQGSV